MTVKLFANLSLFDGAGEGGAAAATGESTGESASTQQAETTDVVYGKQPTEQEGEAAKDEPKAKSADERRKAYQDFVNSADYKDIHTDETQRIINRRFKETKQLEEALNKQNAIMDMLKQRYKVEDVEGLQNAIETDTAYWQEEALEAGFDDVNQYMSIKKLERDNARLLKEKSDAENAQRVNQQISQWMAEADGVKAKFPEFDLDKALEDDNFASMLRSGVPMEHAYKVLNFDAILANATQSAAQATEKAVVDSVRAKGARPAENGISSKSAFVVKDDVKKLTKEDRANIAARVARGEMISF